MSRVKKSRKLFFKVFNSRKKLIVLVLLIVFIIGLAAFWHKNQKTNKTVYVPTSTPTVQPTPFNGIPTPTSLPYKESTQHETKRAIIQDDYAIIPELGIRFKITEELKTLLYTMNTYYGPEYQNYGKSFADISTESLLKMRTWCEPDDPALGIIGKSLENPDLTPLGGGPMKNEIKKIGDYYYHYLHPQAACSDDNDAQAAEARQIQLLREAFQTLEAIQ